MRSVTVRIFGGRDVGKTTIAMHACAELRWMGVPTALSYGMVKLWDETQPIVDMRIFERDPHMLTPHEAAELCRDSLNFLVLRRKYYWDDPPIYLAPHDKLEDLRTAWDAADEKLEMTLRAGHVAYKSLPGVRASVQYVVHKVCERVGYDK